jgi:hypothetical protein
VSMQRWFLMQASRPNGRHEKPWIKRVVATEVSEPLPLLFLCHLNPHSRNPHRT